MKKVIPDTISDKLIDLYNLSIRPSVILDLATQIDKNKARESMDEILLFIVAFFEYNLNMERIELQTLKSKKGYHGVYTEDITNLNRFNMNQNLNMTNIQITDTSSQDLVENLQQTNNNAANMNNAKNINNAKKKNNQMEPEDDLLNAQKSEEIKDLSEYERRHIASI